MGFTEQDRQRVIELDDALRSSDDGELFITPDDEGFYSWYARLLSSLAVLKGDDVIVFGGTIVDGTSARLVVVTERAVMVADVQDTTGNETVPVQVAPLSSMTALSVSASMRYDVKGPLKTGWPGNLVLEADFEGFPDAVRFEGSSYDRYATDNVGDISHLLELLRSKLGV